MPPQAVVVIPAYNPPCHALYVALMAARLPFLVRTDCSDQTRARGHLLTKGLESGAERIVMIDADMAPTTEQVLALAGSEWVSPCEAVSGIYPTKNRNTWAYDEATNRAGLGFCCVHRESLLRVKKTLGMVQGEEVEWVPFTMPTYAEGKYSGNDFAFWERFAAHGVTLRVDKRLRVAHRFMATFTEPDL